MWPIKSLISWFGKKKNPRPRQSLVDLENRRVALIAGRGQYPLLCAQRMRDQGIHSFLIYNETENSEELEEIFPEENRLAINPGQIGKLLKGLRDFDVDSVLLAGQVAPKRLFNGLKLDWTAIRLLATLREKNAESIFGLLVREIEKLNVRVLDARTFMDDDLAKPGWLTASSADLSDLPLGIHTAKGIAELNVGQGVIVAKGVILLVEGFDGTDKMLQRCADFSTKNKLFVKTSRPGQDFRFDVPVIGSRTLQSMLAGGVSCLAVEAGKTILLDKKNLIQEAERLNLAIYGYEN